MQQPVGLVRRSLSGIFCVALVAAASLPLSAAELRVPITARGATGEPVQGTVTLTPVAVPGLQRSQAMTAPVEVPGLFGIADLEAGTWMIEVRAAGYWHPSVVETIGDARTDLPIALWATARITGTVTVPPGKSSPKELLVRFQSPPSIADAQRIPIAEIKCPVTDDRWSCRVPAGALDLRLRATPFQTHFRWDALVSRDKTNDFGVVPLRTGSSLIGFVNLAAGAKGNVAKVKISLQPQTFAQPAAEAPRAAMRVQTAAVNARGFFRIEGVPPGDYVVLAQLDGASSPPIKVRLLPDREVELLDALSIAPPKSLSIAISPPLAPSLEPWRVALMAEAGPPGRADLVTEETAGVDGTWRRVRVPSGRYLIRVKDTDGSTWLDHRLDTSVDPTQIALVVPLVTVHGTVKLGDSPLAAKVIFGGRGASIAIPLQADAEGRYRGVIRRDPGLLRRLPLAGDARSRVRRDRRRHPARPDAARHTSGRRSDRSGWTACLRSDGPHQERRA